DGGRGRRAHRRSRIDRWPRGHAPRHRRLVRLRPEGGRMTAFAVDNGLPYLALSVASQTYAVSATSVMEIVSLQPLTPLPTMPACVLGLMNLRGTVIPVIDLGEKLGFGPTAIGPRTCAMVVMTQ